MIEKSWGNSFVQVWRLTQVSIKEMLLVFLHSHVITQHNILNVSKLETKRSQFYAWDSRRNFNWQESQCVCRSVYHKKSFKWQKMLTLNEYLFEKHFYVFLREQCNMKEISTWRDKQTRNLHTSFTFLLVGEINMTVNLLKWLLIDF